MLACLLTYLHACIPTYLPACLFTCLPVCLPACLYACLYTHHRAPSLGPSSAQRLRLWTATRRRRGNGRYSPRCASGCCGASGINSLLRSFATPLFRGGHSLSYSCSLRLLIVGSSHEVVRVFRAPHLTPIFVQLND